MSDLKGASLMTRIARFVFAAVLLVPISISAFAQKPSAADLAKAEKSFDAANLLMEQRKPAEALVLYKEALTILPKDPTVLFNAGMAAFGSKDYATALDFWKQVKALEPTDWHARAKLIQVYQALGKTAERDAERTELIAMWKKGEPTELKQQFEFCREQFEVKGKKVMAFEHFELKGERALRYVFSILDDTGEAEAWRISLGSYDFTNAVWRETRNPPPKEGERLFHLDGYFKSGSHATYGMFFPEPTYDETRARVVKILEGADHPFSSTVPAQAPKAEPTPKP
jgi:tetratricopeptide (TPR) repeat protein